VGARRYVRAFRRAVEGAREAGDAATGGAPGTSSVRDPCTWSTTSRPTLPTWRRRRRPRRCSPMPRSLWRWRRASQASPRRVNNQSTELLLHLDNSKTMVVVGGLGSDGGLQSAQQLLNEGSPAGMDLYAPSPQRARVRPSKRNRRRPHLGQRERVPCATSRSQWVRCDTIEDAVQAQAKLRRVPRRQRPSPAQTGSPWGLRALVADWAVANAQGVHGHKVG
jgi:hypothetical protein